jgi:hypothetical protein
MWFDEKLGIESDSQGTWLNRWSSVLRTVLTLIVKKFAANKGRKRNYLNEFFVKGKITSCPTAHLMQTPFPDDPDSPLSHHFITPFPLPERKLVLWVEELQSHSDMCKAFGFSLSTTPSAATTASTASEHTALDPLKEPEETPQRMEGILAAAKVAEEGLATTIEKTIRNNTDSVSCPSAIVSNQKRRSNKFSPPRNSSPSSLLPSFPNPIRQTFRRPWRISTFGVKQR